MAAWYFKVIKMGPIIYNSSTRVTSIKLSKVRGGPGQFLKSNKSIGGNIENSSAVTVELKVYINQPIGPFQFIPQHIHTNLKLIDFKNIHHEQTFFLISFIMFSCSCLRDRKWPSRWSKSERRNFVSDPKKWTTLSNRIPFSTTKQLDEWYVWSFMSRNFLLL